MWLLSDATTISLALRLGLLDREPDFACEHLLHILERNL